MMQSTEAVHEYHVTIGRLTLTTNCCAEAEFYATEHDANVTAVTTSNPIE